MLTERARGTAFQKLKKRVEQARARGERLPDLVLVDEKNEESEECDLVDLLELGKVEEDQND